MDFGTGLCAGFLVGLLIGGLTGLGLGSSGTKRKVATTLTRCVEADEIKVTDSYGKRIPPQDLAKFLAG